jgi:lysyl-tRNA synthetase class 2
VSGPGDPQAGSPQGTDRVGSGGADPGAAGSDAHHPDLPLLRFRAECLRKVRDFFREREVLEIETPILSRGISLDCHIDVFSSTYHPLGHPTPGPGGAGETFFLQTSPEPHMKRLLCLGFPDLYQVTKAFRNGESGRVHNPEFTMLEWYRRGFTLEDLMDEVEALCLLLAPGMAVERITWQAAFRRALGFDPLDLSLEALMADPAVAAVVPTGHAFPSRADAWDFLMAHQVESTFPRERLTFVTGFPVEQAAQAQVDPADRRLAKRFEVYGQGMEIGNGYLELLDTSEYDRRFDSENVKRRSQGKPELPKDSRLLADLRRGLPPCAGVAMGLDRMVILGAGRRDIGAVLSFPWETC